MQSLPTRWGRLILGLLAAGLLSTPSLAAESDAVAALVASPDGRFIAVAGTSGELAVLDLEHSGALPIHSRHLEGESAWSRDSRSLVFAERFPGGASALWVVRPEIGRLPRPLATGVDWKGRPGWLDARRVAFLSDRDSDHVNVWVADAETTGTVKLLDRGREISRLWVSPTPGEFIYRSAESGTSELWWHWGEASDPIRITQDPANEPRSEDLVAFAPDGRTIVFVSDSAAGPELVRFDLAGQIQAATLRLETRPEALALGADGDVLVSKAGRLHVWRSSRRGSRLSDGEDWHGAGLAHPVRLGSASWAAVAMANLIVTFEDLDRLDEARIHARAPGDLVQLAASWQMAGSARPARSMLDSLWNAGGGPASDRFAIAATRALLEQRHGKTGPADRWLGDALALTKVGGEQALAIWHARLLLAFFEARDVDGARRILETMPEPAKSHRRALWVRDLLQLEDARARRLWQRAGAAVRAARWNEAAGLLDDLIRADAGSPIHRRGVALLLQGDLEPLRQLLAPENLRYRELLDEFRFQQLLLALSDADLSPELTKAELRAMLLAQWAETGQRQAAQNLVLRDLRDPEGSSLRYAEMLGRFLDAEEQERWTLRAVQEVLLSREAAPLLDRVMNETGLHLVFTLARAKGAFIEGDRDNLEQTLAQLERDLAIIPRSFWNAENVRLLIMFHVYRAKLFEMRRQWEPARTQYDLARETLVRFVRDWGMLPFDLELARARLTEPTTDADLLPTLLQVERGLGDPLVNPARDPQTVRVGLTNLRTLRRFASAGWARATVDYLEGASLAALKEPDRAVEILESARARETEKSLRARMLIEEAAARGVLGQRLLESELLARLCGLGLDPPQLTVAIRMRAQAEKAAGLIESQENRMRHLCRELRLPRPWAAVLIDENTILPLEGEPPPGGE